ncbi:MAG: hypothetical protein M1838_002906 [Thelocarpon superellum]|nr:MAG: hypothetical protein M1838_002906 [Thelocarpon superellum]
MADEEEYLVPLQDQRVFGAGLKRKRVQFVPSSAASASTPPASAADGTDGGHTGAYYLSIVLQDPTHSGSTDGLPQKRVAADEGKRDGGGVTSVCDVCHLPIDGDPHSNADEPRDGGTRPHEASLAHQVCLTHSHLPSHLDRRRKGLQYLEAYGWDPDSRRGLGASGDGIRDPIKARAKYDTLGVGITRPVEKAPGTTKAKVVKFDAKQVRLREAEARKKGERLRQTFYGNGELEKYLGPQE